MNRAYNIAFLARRFRLIADRPEFLNDNRTERMDRALTDDAPGRLPLLDAVLIIGASELDRLGGYAVRVMRRKGSRLAELLDVLGMLSADHICALYYALPEERRQAALRDPVWAYHVGQLDADEMTEALAWAEEAGAPASPIAAALTQALLSTPPQATHAA